MEQKTLRQQWRHILRLVKVQHTLFSLPFALAAMLVACRNLNPPQSGPSLKTLVLIILALLFARNAAMSFNRLLDRSIDTRNPRTQERELPTGKVSPGFTWGFCLINGLLFCGAAFLLHPLCFYLAPFWLLVLLGYSLTKRFTWTSHYVLGLALGLSPLGAAIAVQGDWPDTLIFILSGSVLFWAAGFDILYALADIEFDRQEGLHSIPARFGIRKALLISRLSHLIAFLLLAEFCRELDIALAGTTSVQAIQGGMLFLVAALLFRESRLVTPTDLSRLNEAFFTVNIQVSTLVFLGIAGATWFAPL